MGPNLGKDERLGHFEFTEWILDGYLHHSKFVALREDKKALNVRRE